MTVRTRFNYQALGRLKSGEMNKTELAYSRYLEGLKHAGEVLWYRFEGIKLRLADNTFLTVDFAVMAKDGAMEMHEVKSRHHDGGGYFALDKSKVKLKVAADNYPFAFFVTWRARGGEWVREEI